MKIKSKIRLGFGFLFVAVLFFGALSLFYINQLSNSAKVILKNNYKTLSFAKEMRTVLDENKLPLNNAAKSVFNKQLGMQEHNITEKGEDFATTELRKAFNVLQAPKSTLAQQENAEHDTRVQLRKIEDLNMLAIVHKTDDAQASVSKATIILGLVAFFTFLTFFSFSVNLSGFIAEPLIALVNGLGEVSRKNYNHHLDFNKNDEFGDMAAAFNHMADRLKDWENSNLTELLAEKRRIETIIELMPDAIIGLNDKQEILFMNTVAQNILNLSGQQLTGQRADKFTANNDLFKSILKSNSASESLKTTLNGKESYFQLESKEIITPNITGYQTDELGIAGRSAGRIFVLRNMPEYHGI